MELPKAFRIAGVFILSAGLIAAVMVYRTAQPEEKLGIVGLDIPSKHDQLQTERLNGKAGLAANDFLEWYGSLWHGRKLGDTLLFLSLAGCAGCFYLAHIKTDLPVADETVKQDPDN
jgi:hypothetical protein